MTAIYGTPGDASAQDPSTDGEVVTASDTVDLLHVSTRLWVGGAGSGNLTVTLASGTKLQLKGVLGGTMLPIRVSRVWATGTDTTNMVSLWR